MKASDSTTGLRYSCCRSRDVDKWNPNRFLMVAELPQQESSPDEAECAQCDDFFSSAVHTGAPAGYCAVDLPCSPRRYVTILMLNVSCCSCGVEDRTKSTSSM